MSSPRRIDSFAFAEGRRLLGKYEVRTLLGRGWEGEVYKVVELKTGITRALKVFFPHRNERDRAARYYAHKLERLRRCSMLIQYHHTESLRVRGQRVTGLVSEFVEGEILSRFVARQKGGRLDPFPAMVLLRALAAGLEEIHAHRDYHGDLHEENIIVNRRGIGFDVRVVDVFAWGRPTRAKMRDDVIQLIRVFYEIIGGRRRYASQPAEVKRICRGLRHDLIAKAFPTAAHLRDYLDTFAWDG